MRRVRVRARARVRLRRVRRPGLRRRLAAVPPPPSLPPPPPPPRQPARPPARASAAMVPLMRDVAFMQCSSRSMGRPQAERYRPRMPSDQTRDVRVRRHGSRVVRARKRCASGGARGSGEFAPACGRPAARFEPHCLLVLVPDAPAGGRPVSLGFRRLRPGRVASGSPRGSLLLETPRQRYASVINDDVIKPEGAGWRQARRDDRHGVASTSRRCAACRRRNTVRRDRVRGLKSGARPRFVSGKPIRSVIIRGLVLRRGTRSRTFRSADADLRVPMRVVRVPERVPAEGLRPPAVGLSRSARSRPSTSS